MTIIVPYRASFAKKSKNLTGKRLINPGNIWIEMISNDELLLNP